MTQVELDSLSDEELQRYIDGVDEDRDARPSREQTAGGAPRGLSVLMLLCGAVGMWASLSLVLAEREQLADPGASLSCDINPLVGCSAFLRSQANALFFGVPNALFGLMFFSGVVALALALLTGSRLNPWVWRLLCVGMAGAAAWLVWFQYQAFAVERALCPYCLVTWFVTIPLIVHVLARSFGAGHLPAGDGARRILVKGRWWLVAAVYLAVALVAVVALWDKWEYVF